MTASPPWLLTASAISGVSVATATRPILASLARRSTWTIIGTPAMSRSGLPGRRVAAIRAGISTRLRVSIIRTRLKLRGIGGVKIAAVYTGCQGTGKPISPLPLGDGVKKIRFLGPFRRPRGRFHVDLPARSLIQDGLLRTQ